MDRRGEERRDARAPRREGADDAARGQAVDVQVAHTAELDARTLAAARALLETVFAGELTDEDWEHGLGGVHALAWEHGEPIGHASVVMRRLLHDGRALRTGYVEAVGVRADHRRRGVANALMEALERVIRSAYDLGALSATDEAIPFYRSRGWRRWEGPTSALTPEGIRRTPDDDGSVHVLGEIEPAGELTCDWREGDVW